MNENTWGAGIQRLLLGLAMTGNDRDLFSGILPYDNMEGEDSLLLGRFLDFLRCLFQICTILEQPKTISRWAAAFITTLNQMFSDADPFERDLQMLRKIIDQMVENAQVSEFENRLDIEVVKTCLRNSIEGNIFGSGFISGGVTFCAMLPMRSIPFKVICLVGLSTDEFPRDVRKLSFDLMAGHPMKGDRSRRDDDKYLFLEALISARETLYISYIGQSVQDNTRIVPSVLVSELIDYIHDRFGVDPDVLVKHHPLQAFSPVYFQEESPFFSYSQENFAAVTQQNARGPQPQVQLPAAWGRHRMNGVNWMWRHCVFFSRTRPGFCCKSAWESFLKNWRFCRTTGKTSGWKVWTGTWWNRNCSIIRRKGPIWMI